MLKAFLDAGITAKTITTIALAVLGTTLITAQMSLPPPRTELPIVAPIKDKNGIQIGTATISGNRTYVRIRGELIDRGRN